jgi:hypothetical protein
MIPKYGVLIFVRASVSGSTTRKDIRIVSLVLFRLYPVRAFTNSLNVKSE